MSASATFAIAAITSQGDSALNSWFWLLAYNDQGNFLTPSGAATSYREVFSRRSNVPSIAWLLGIPLSIVFILILVGVF